MGDLVVKPEQKSGCLAVVLAGGDSRRMGTDKSVLELGGKSLLSWVRGAVAPLGIPLSVLREDIEPGFGPLGGVKTALMGSEDRPIVFFSCDMPFVRPEAVQRLIAAGETNRGGAFCEVSGRWGFPILLKPETLPVVSSRLDSGERSLGGLLSELRCARVVFDASEEWQFLNLNTPADLERAQDYLTRVPDLDLGH